MGTADKVSQCIESASYGSVCLRACVRLGRWFCFPGTHLRTEHMFRMGARTSSVSVLKHAVVERQRERERQRFC